MCSVLGYRWFDALREAGDRQIRRKRILDLFADPRHPFIDFSVAGIHCDALGERPDPAVREVIWRALRIILTESKALIPRYQQEHPEDQSAYAAADLELHVYLDVMQLAMAAFEAAPWLRPNTEAEWLVIVDNPVLELMAMVSLSGTDNPLLKRKIDQLATGGLAKSQDLAAWLSKHLNRSEGVAIGGIGPVEAVSLMEKVVAMNQEPEHSEAVVIAIDAFLLYWYRDWSEPTVWQHVLPVRERLLKLVDWSIAHDLAGQYSSIARGVRDRLAAQP